MKNALSLYIEMLADRFEKAGTVTQLRDAGMEARKVWKLLTAQIAEELERRQLAAVAAEIVAASPKARAALAEEAGDFGPIREALDRIKAKTVVPSSMRSAEWAAMPVEIREASQFSAGVASARVMTAIQSRLQSDAAWDFGVPSGREAFIRDMRAVMEAEGVGWESKGEGSITNPRANSRLGLIYDQQTTSARGYAARKIGMDRGMLQEVPAQELIREQEPKGGPGARRPWTKIWTEKGGRLAGGRMAALKTDGIWTAISRFGVPWPPFDFGSHMGVRDILRDEAEELGLIGPDDDVAPEPVPDYGRTVEASAAEVGEQALGWLRQAFGGRLVQEGDALRLAPKGSAE
jgi:hypothetical protein